MKKVLVFGGVGFLGYYLVNELLRRGYEVSIADISENREIDNINYYTCDISDRKNIRDVFSKEKFNFVYNLAGFANIDKAISDPLKTMNLNVISNMYIIEECLKHGVEKFIYASSAYAVSDKGSFYGISKLASEKIIEEYHTKYGLNFVILRYGSVYAEKDYDNNYIYNLVKEALKTGQINHKGDGNEIREYIHAADAGRLSVDVIEDSKFDEQHVILTGNERMKRMELFEMIKEILKNDLVINCSDSGEYGNHYKFTPYSFAPTASKKYIANPHIDMGQGLLECIRAAHNQNEKDS